MNFTRPAGAKYDEMVPVARRRGGPDAAGRLRRVALPCESLPLALFLVALLTGLAGNVLLLLTGLRLPALLLPRPLLTAALLLTGLLIGCLRRLRSVVRIIHLNTSFG
jgi:hypothetical protein